MYYPGGTLTHPLWMYLTKASPQISLGERHNASIPAIDAEIGCSLRAGDVAACEVLALLVFEHPARIPCTAFYSVSGSNSCLTDQSNRWRMLRRSP
jgi:hypothetical protein